MAYTILVSDSATIFTANEFKMFCKWNGSRQRVRGHEHSPTNDHAECCVEINKKKLKSMEGKGIVHKNLQTFWLNFIIMVPIYY